VIHRLGWRRLIEVERPWLHFIRAMIGAVETAMFYWAVRKLPLADAMTYYLAGPIYVTVMASLFLREKVGWRRWAAVLIGFLGVVIALGPSATSFGPYAFIAFAGSIVYSVFLVMTRALRQTSETVMTASSSAICHRCRSSWARRSSSAPGCSFSFASRKRGCRRRRRRRRNGNYSPRSAMSSRWIISARPENPRIASISLELRPAIFTA
jgi:hypothetical protein